MLAVLVLGCTFVYADNGADKNTTALQATISSMPLVFIQNNGQFEDEVSYQTRSPDQVITVLSNGLEFNQSPGNSSVFMMLNGSNPDKKIIGINQLNGTANFYYGNDPSAWVTGVTLTSGVKYEEVYPGIDLTVSGKEGLLKSEFILDAGADPGSIELVYQGQDNLTLDAVSGDLIIKTPSREIRDEAPYAYQEINGTRTNVTCSYVIGEESTVTFSLGQYDSTYPLVIDPVMRYSLYFGGEARDQGNSIAVDENGCAYFIGTSWSQHMKFLKGQKSAGSADGGDGLSAQGLAPGSVQPYFGGGDKDAFVIKINPDGTDLLYYQVIGGSGTDEGTGLTIDREGFAYIVGGTNSKNFPTKNAYRAQNAGKYDAWMAKIDPSGKDLVFSTYLGGEDNDYAFAVAIDNQKNVFLTGQTQSWNFPTVNRYQLSPYGGLSDAFITKFVPEGNSIVYSNFIGGSAYEAGSAVSVDSNGFACIVGQTESPNFPVIKPYQDKLHGPFDAFVTKFDPEGKYPASYSTYLGGNGWEDGRGIIAQPDGSLTVVGITKSKDFPTVKPIQPMLKGLQDGFITTLTPDGGSLSQSTYFGGSLIDTIFGIARDAKANIYVVGTTDSPDLPVVRAYQSKPGGSSDVMVAKFLPDISQSVYVTYLGGGSIDQGRAISVTREGEAYFTGYTESKNFPKVWPYQQNYGDGDRDAFVVSLSEYDMIPVTDFIGEPTKGDAPLTVQFTDKSLGIPTSWAWEFGDGETSTERNPRHVYKKPGVYTVTLSAKNIVSTQKKTKPNYITALEPIKPPVAEFSANPTSGMVPLKVSFTDQSTNQPDSWNWVFGDGGTSQDKNPVYEYKKPGVFTVNLTVKNRAGISSKAKPEFIHANPAVIPPKADFSANPTSGMVPLTVTFSDLSKNGPTSWAWTFGDGGTSSERNPVYKYVKPGTYAVTLKVSNSAGSDQITKPEFIHAQPSILPPVAKFTGEPRTGVAPLKVVFTDKSENNPATWQWNFGDGQTSVEPNPVHIYEKPGKYTVSLTVTNPAGTDTRIDENFVTVNPSVLAPIADFSGNPTSGKAPLTVNFLDLSKNNPKQWFWKFGDGATSEEKNPVHIYQKEGKYTVELTVSNEGGADTKVATEFVTVSPPGFPPQAQFRGYPTSGNAPLTVGFTDLSSGNPTTWKWDFGDGQVSDKQHPEHVYSTPGVYTVSLMVGNQFGSSTEVKERYIQIYEKPIPLKASFMGEPTSGNAPLTVKFSDLSTGNPQSWLWNFGDGTTATDHNPVHVYTNPGEYTVFLTVARGEERSSEVRYQYIKVVSPGKPPVPDFVASPTTGNAPLTVQFTDLSKDNPKAWRWDFGDGQASNEKNPVHVYNKPGTYTVCLEASNEFGAAATCKDGLIKIYEPPQQAAEFFGHVTVDGAPGKIGTIIEARGNGVDVGTTDNPTTMTLEGVYGTPVTLKVKGQIKNGEPVTFWIKSPGTNEFVQAECYDVFSGKEWVKSFPFRAGLKTRLDLRIGEAPIPPMPVLPHEFFGEITKDGMAMPIGSMVIVRGENVIEGHRGNPLAIISPGIYGFIGQDKLIAQGELKSGQPLSFWVIPAGSGEALPAEVRDVNASGQWVSTYPYSEGGLTRLDIRVKGGNPPVPVTPMTLSGIVTINGQPAVAGSLITANGNGVSVGIEGNPVQVGPGGRFGDGNKLTIKGTVQAGTPVKLLIFDALSGKESVAEIKDPQTGAWVTSIVYNPGTDLQLEIRASSIIPAATQGDEPITDIGNGSNNIPVGTPVENVDTTPLIAASISEENQSKTQ